MGDAARGHSAPIRVDSVEEEYAYLAAYPPENGAWQIVSQALSLREDGPTDVLEARDAEGRSAVFAFDIGSFFGAGPDWRLGGPTTEFFDALVQRAGAFARDNGPQHPGSLPRFPVPSARYAGRVDLPIAVLAADERGRGMFAPPRVVTLDYWSGEPVGVGEFPGFDPASWPPPRLGDWPPNTLAAVDRGRLAGLVARFSGIGTRLYDAWIGGTPSAKARVGDERAEFLALLVVLEPNALIPYYRLLSPEFWAWLEGSE